MTAHRFPVVVAVALLSASAGAQDTEDASALAPLRAADAALSRSATNSTAANMPSPRISPTFG